MTTELQSPLRDAGDKANDMPFPATVESPMAEEEITQLADAEAMIDTAMHGVVMGFVQIGSKLTAIQIAKLYRERHETFSQYCAKRWHMSTGRAYQLMRGAVAYWATKEQYAKDLPQDEAMAKGLVPANEAQVRKLAPLMEKVDHKAGRKAVCAVWERVLSRKAKGRLLTAALVSEEVTKWNGRPAVQRRASWDYEARPPWRSGPAETAHSAGNEH